MRYYYTMIVEDNNNYDRTTSSVTEIGDFERLISDSRFIEHMFDLSMIVIYNIIRKVSANIKGGQHFL